MPLGQGGGTALLEDGAAIEMTILIEMVMDRGVNKSKLLKGFPVPELRHRPLPSSERLMRVFGSVVEPLTTFLSRSIPNRLHRGTV